MKQLFYITSILLFLLTGSATFGHTNDSLNQTTTSILKDTITTKSNPPEIDQLDDDFSPGLFFFALIGVIFILMIVGAGMLLTALGILIIFGLISFGILSTSIIIGLNKKSFSKGFKTFIVLTSTIGGLASCGLGVWLLNKSVHWWTPQTAIIIGAICGLLSGSTFGLFAYYVFQRFTTYLKQKLNLTT